MQEKYVVCEGSLPRLEASVVPCSIKHTREVKGLGNYWMVEKNADGTLESYLRGRKLKGKELHLNGYKGYLLQKENDEDKIDDNVNVNYSAIGEIETFQNFGHERIPDANDSTNKIQEWLKVSSIIHE
ncbi:hypothetical protein LJB42_000097 [Komagataella kurtzmanii]|nr:hypothetical protein LJB42_000097 [Komagataella kurtzmanii]